MTELTLYTELSEEQKDNLKIAKSCADSLLGVINDILDFSKIEAGKMIIEEIEFNLRSTLERIIRPLLYKANHKYLELSYEISPDIPEAITGDPHRLQQVLNNLVSNSVKFTDLGSVNVIIEKTFSRGNVIELKFTVKDTGIGISENEMERLFKSFSQVDGSYTRKYGGTGLGLAISKQLVEMMGGEIWVESVKGKGSSFIFTVKFGKGGGKTVSQAKPSKKESYVDNILKVLVVEDDKVNQMLITRFLQSRSYKVELAENGKVAFEKIITDEFDVILMDIQMPVMDGMEATRLIRMKEARSGKYTPIIALTAHALQGDKDKFIKAGMDDYF